MNGDNKRVLGLLGIAKKAGKAALGTEMAQNAVRNKKSGCLLLCSAEASDATLKRIKNTADYYKVPLVVLDVEKSALAACVGKRDGELSVVAVTDAGLSKAIAEDIARREDK